MYERYEELSQIQGLNLVKTVVECSVGASNKKN